MKNCSTNSPGSACGTVATPKLIQLGNGSYPELNILRKVSNLTIVGESRDGVVVGDENFESLNSGSGASAASAGTALSTSGKTGFSAGISVSSVVSDSSLPGIAALIPGREGVA